MMNFRIKIERLNNDRELSEKLERGIEVDGFVLLADMGDRTMNCINYMSVSDIASAIHGDKNIVKAAVLSGIANAVEGDDDE